MHKNLFSVTPHHLLLPAVDCLQFPPSKLIDCLQFPPSKLRQRKRLFFTEAQQYAIEFVKHSKSMSTFKSENACIQRGNGSTVLDVYSCKKNIATRSWAATGYIQLSTTQVLTAWSDRVLSMEITRKFICMMDYYHHSLKRLTGNADWCDHIAVT